MEGKKYGIAVLSGSFPRMKVIYVCFPNNTKNIMSLSVFMRWLWREINVSGTSRCGNPSSLVHASNISTRIRSIRKQSMISPLGLAKTKQQKIFLGFVFCSTTGLCLWRSSCRRLDFTPLFCLVFCPYSYVHVWTRPESLAKQKAEQRNEVKPTT